MLKENTIDISSIKEFLKNYDLQKIIQEYEEASKKSASPGFNVFTMISDYFYRENFHSDILAAFLDPKGAHGEKDKFLKIFLEMLNISHIDSYGEESIVEKEVGLKGNNGRIDILITNKDHKHCIIIENKLNDAPDMSRQLPRYYDAMHKKSGLEVDAIVYLPLSSHCEPCKETWIVEDRANVDPLLKIISAAKLLSLWINPSLVAAESLDSIAILRQYANLLIYLTQQKSIDNMKELLDFFIKNPNEFKMAVELYSMLNKLPSALVNHLKDKVFCDLQVGSWDNYHSNLFFTLDKENCIFVYCKCSDKETYKLGVRDFSNNIAKLTWIKPEDLKEKGFEIVNEGNGCFWQQFFDFGKEKEMEDMVNELLEIWNINKLS